MQGSKLFGAMAISTCTVLYMAAVKFFFLKKNHRLFLYIFNIFGQWPVKTVCKKANWLILSGSIGNQLIN